MDFRSNHLLDLTECQPSDICGPLLHYNFAGSVVSCVLSPCRPVLLREIHLAALVGHCTGSWLSFGQDEPELVHPICSHLACYHECVLVVRIPLR